MTKEREPRSRLVATRLTVREADLVAEAAVMDAVAVSVFVRRAVLPAARARIKEEQRIERRAERSE
jgi:uncharacterized protein (DUF1778 family)